MIALVNVLIIPVFVDLAAKIQYKETKSDMQKTILILNFIYMALNMIFLPLTGLVSLDEFLSYVVNADT